MKKHNKKLLSTVAAAAVVVSAVPAFAAEAEAVVDGLYINVGETKYYFTTDELFSGEHGETIADLLNEADLENVFFVQGGTYVTAEDAFENVDYNFAELEEDTIPTGEYVGTDGTPITVGTPETTEPTVLTVESVSAINNNGVIVVFEAVTEAQEDVTVEVKNPSGTIVPVKAVDLAVGDTEVFFAFETAITGKLESGLWTVNGTEYDQAAVDAATAVSTATTQAALLEALKSPYFVNVDEANIVAYNTNKATADLTTVATIQETLIDATNAEVNQNSVVETIIETADEEGNEIKLLALLKENNFERLIDGNVAGANGYLAKIDALAPYVAQDAEDIQDEIDAANLAIAQAAVVTAETSVKREDYNKALTQVNNLDSEGQKSDKETALTKLTVVDALIALEEAQTNAAFGNKLVALSKLTAAGWVSEPVYAVNYAAYKADVQAEANADRNTVAKVEALINTANLEQSAAQFTAAKLTEIENLDATKTADLAKFDTWLKAIDARVADTDFDYEELVKSAALATYLTDVQADLTGGSATIDASATGEANAAALATIIDDANNSSLSDAIDDVKAATATNATDLYEALAAPALGVKNVAEANKAAYFADKAIFATVTGGGSDDAADKLIIQNAVNAANATVAFNTATTTAQAANAVTAIALANGYTNLVNLPAAARTDIAELLIELKPTAGFATTAALVAELGTANNATTGTGSTTAFKVFNDKLTAINTAGKTTGTISALVTALSGLEYDAYDNLDAIVQTKVAETLLAGWPTDGATTSPSKVDYTSWTAVKAAIDAALAN